MNELSHLVPIIQEHAEELRGEQDDRADIKGDVGDHRYGASSSSRRAISGSQRSPFASNFALS